MVDWFARRNVTDHDFLCTVTTGPLTSVRLLEDPLRYAVLSVSAPLNSQG